MARQSEQGFSRNCAGCTETISGDAIECGKCGALTPAGYEKQSVFMERVRAEVVAFEKEYGERRSATIGTTTRFLRTLNAFAEEANLIHLPEMKNALQEVSISEKQFWEDKDLPGFQDVFGEAHQLFEQYQHLIVGQTLKRIEVISRRIAKDGVAPSLQDLQHAFYARAKIELIRIKDAVENSESLLAGEDGQFRATVDELRWEAEALQVEMPLVLRFWNLRRRIKVRELTLALLYIEHFLGRNVLGENSPTPQ